MQSHADMCQYVKFTFTSKYEKMAHVYVLDVYLGICGDQVSNDHECMCEHTATRKGKGRHFKYQIPFAA